MNELSETFRQALERTKIISIHAAAKMCDMKLDCHDPAHDDRWCARCDAMQDAADQIKQKILNILSKGQKGVGERIDLEKVMNSSYTLLETYWNQTSGQILPWQMQSAANLAVVGSPYFGTRSDVTWQVNPVKAFFVERVPQEDFVEKAKLNKAFAALMAFSPSPDEPLELDRVRLHSDNFII